MSRYIDYYAVTAIEHDGSLKVLCFSNDFNTVYNFAYTKAEEIRDKANKKREEDGDDDKPYKIITRGKEIDIKQDGEDAIYIIEVHIVKETSVFIK